MLTCVFSQRHHRSELHHLLGPDEQQHSEPGQRRSCCEYTRSQAACWGSLAPATGSCCWGPEGQNGLILDTRWVGGWMDRRINGWWVGGWRPLLLTRFFPLSRSFLLHLSSSSLCSHRQLVTFFLETVFPSSRFSQLVVCFGLWDVWLCKYSRHLEGHISSVCSGLSSTR